MAYNGFMDGLFRVRMRAPGLGAVRQVWIVALILAPTAALAQGTGAGSPQPPTPGILDRVARNHFELGTQEFRLGRYEQAAHEFQQAYDVTHQAELLFNLARAYESAGNLAAALDAYQRYEAAGAAGFDRAVLQERIESLRRRVAASTVTPAVPASPSTNANSTASASAPANGGTATPPAMPSSPPIPRARTTYRMSGANAVVPPVLMALGGAVGVTSAIFAVMALGPISRINQANMSTTPWSTDLAGDLNTANSFSTMAWALGIGGGATFATGLIWLAARGPGEAREVPIAIAPMIGAHGVVATWRGGL